MDKPYAGQEVELAKDGRSYRVRSLVRMKCDGEWHDSVNYVPLYECEHTDFTRTLDDFMASFRPKPDAAAKCPGCNGYGIVGGGMDQMPCTDCLATGEAQPADTGSDQGQWVRCTPALINAGVSCGMMPRRDGDGTYSHDHWIAFAEPTVLQPRKLKCRRCGYPKGTGIFTCACESFLE